MTLGVIAFTCFALFLVLGYFVSRRPLGVLDARAVFFRSQAIPLALVFTKSGRSTALWIGYVISIGVYAIARLPLWIPLLMTGSQIASQVVVEMFKRVYGRMRPDYWLVGLEAGLSYPSGHAVTAVVSFIGWSIVIGLSALPDPVKYPLVALFVLWALGIIWSRLALGAHYLSDVAGGALFGTGWLCTLLAVLRYH